MARVPMPNQDVAFLNPNGTVSKPWLDFLSFVDRLRVQDLRDIAPGSSPADTNTIRYSASNKNWTFGA